MECIYKYSNKLSEQLKHLGRIGFGLVIETKGNLKMSSSLSYSQILIDFLLSLIIDILKNFENMLTISNKKYIC